MLGAVAAMCCVARPATGADLCTASNLIDTANRPDADWSSCVVSYRDVLLETGYYQNASSVGGLTIAEYPNAELRAGLIQNVELFVDPPTQVDRSLGGGLGDFTLSDPGLGVKWQLADWRAAAIAFGAEVGGPSTAASFHTQQKYRFEADGLRRAGKVRATLGLALIDEDRHRAFSEPPTPALRPSAGLGVATSPATTISLELLDQTSVARSLHAQSFDGVAFRQALSRHVVVDIEGGQTINTAADTRPHYIGAGFVFGSTSRE